MSKPILCVVASYTEGCERFVKSLEKIQQQIELVHISYEPSIPGLPIHTYHESIYPGNLKRFESIPKLDDNRFIIFSDTSDVVFQRELPDFERMNYEVYLGSENVKHDETIWKGFIERNPYFRELSQKNVFNAGLFAMRVSVFKKLLFFMKENIKWVDPQDMGIADQMLFNLFFSKNPFYDVYTGLDIFCPLYRNLELNQVIVRKGLFILSTGQVPVAVHANGNNKRVLDDGRAIDKLHKKKKDVV